MNKIVLIGNLTHDPEKRATSRGTFVTSFTIAVDRRFSSENGEKQTDFFRINAWNKLADSCARFLAKGRKVAVIGELQARTYDAKDGTTRLSLDVSADEVEFLSPKEEKKPDPKPRYTDPDTFEDVSSDDLPWED